MDELPGEPYELFAKWYAQAVEQEPNDPNAVAVATADKEGKPHARMMLMKGYDTDGFLFFTNLESNKGVEILANPHVALCFHWKSLLKQIRIEGPVRQVDDEEADSYFNSRPRGSKIGAWASLQSRVVQSREEFEARYKQFQNDFEDKDIPRPPNWTGFRLVPERIEFWQQQEYRLHRRILYKKEGEAWAQEMLYP